MADTTLTVWYVCLCTHVTCLCGGQRVTLGVGLHLPSCLRWSLLDVVLHGLGWGVGAVSFQGFSSLLLTVRIMCVDVSKVKKGKATAMYRKEDLDTGTVCDKIIWKDSRGASCCS